MKIQLSEERKAQLKNRLAEIESKAENVNGYYVLKEKGKTTVFCHCDNSCRFFNGVIAYAGGRWFSAYETYFKYSPNTAKYGYAITVKNTAKVTLRALYQFINSAQGGAK